MKAKTKIAIACQGGGSQTAFTAGAVPSQKWWKFGVV
jgi:predicted acylesterase/phospholipase RssA